ncbi:unnamed protein product, partial [Amoebophrya sp. A25]|eukprot:GSA25T00008916001.1
MGRFVRRAAAVGFTAACVLPVLSVKVVQGGAPSEETTPKDGGKTLEHRAVPVENVKSASSVGSGRKNATAVEDPYMVHNPESSDVPKLPPRADDLKFRVPMLPTTGASASASASSGNPPPTENATSRAFSGPVREKQANVVQDKEANVEAAKEKVEDREDNVLFVGFSGEGHRDDKQVINNGASSSSTGKATTGDKTRAEENGEKDEISAVVSTPVIDAKPSSHGGKEDDKAADVASAAGKKDGVPSSSSAGVQEVPIRVSEDVALSSTTGFPRIDANAKRASRSDVAPTSAASAAAIPGECDSEVGSVGERRDGDELTEEAATPEDARSVGVEDGVVDVLSSGDEAFECLRKPPASPRSNS